MNVLKYRIHLIHFFLIIVRLKTFDFLMQRKIKQEIQSLLKRRIIRSDISLYSISISVITKKNGIIRIYLTPIGLNATTINDRQPMSNMKELMDAIARAKFYSS